MISTPPRLAVASDSSVMDALCSADEAHRHGDRGSYQVTRHPSLAVVFTDPLAAPTKKAPERLRVSGATSHTEFSDKERLS